MKQNSQLRAEARQALEGNWGDAALISVVACVIEGILSASFEFSGVKMMGDSGGSLSLSAGILFLPIEFAWVVAFLRMIRGAKIEVKDLFSTYNGRVFLTMLLKTIYIFLWALLFVIPGIVKSYSYAMTEFLMHDNPELQNNAAIEKSMQMMQGKKMKLFLLDLSFIGWFLLCILTMGLGFILLIPYVNTAHAAFYEDLKAELEPQTVSENTVTVEAPVTEEQSGYTKSY